MVFPVPAGECRNSLPSGSQRLLMFEFIDFVSKVVQGTYFVKDSHSSREKKKESRSRGEISPFPSTCAIREGFL